MAQLAAHNGGGLVRGLGTYQILFITLGGTIGLGFATTSGRILAISGPAGVLIAFGVVGFIAICVMEGVCEMIVLWPISNAMIEFVRAFVDPDLAIVVGITYWYTYAVTLAALIIGSADLLNYWSGFSFPLLNVTYVLFLLVLFIINSRGVRVFGWFELVGGIFKVLLVFVIFVLMMCINTGNLGDKEAIGSTFFNDGITHNPNVASTPFNAVMVSIPLALFSYIGVELITVTAFEAQNPSRLKGPVKHIAYLVTVVYLILIGGFVANIEWFNKDLPKFYFQDHVDVVPGSSALGHIPWTFHNSSNSTAAPVIAALQAGIPILPGVLVGFIVYSGLSTANSALYVASRTLYGLTRDLDQLDSRRVVRFFAKLNTISPTTKIPVWALIVSTLAFSSWLPFVHLQNKFTQSEMQQTLIEIGSVGCLLVWASQCLAFIRYNKWLSMHRAMLVGSNMGRYQRWPRTGFSSYAASVQPGPAYIGFAFCLVIVFILNAVSMFNGEQLQFKALTIYLGPLLLVIIFVILKVWNRRSYVKLGSWEQLRDTLTTLNDLIDGPQGNTPPPSTADLPNLPPPAPPNPFAYQPPSPPPSHSNEDPSNTYTPPPAPPMNEIIMPPTADQLHAVNVQAQDNRGHSPYAQDEMSPSTELPVTPDSEGPMRRNGSTVSALDAHGGEMGWIGYGRDGRGGSVTTDLRELEMARMRSQERSREY